VPSAFFLGGCGFGGGLRSSGRQCRPPAGWSTYPSGTTYTGEVGRRDAADGGELQIVFPDLDLVRATNGAPVDRQVFDGRSVVFDDRDDILAAMDVVDGTCPNESAAPNQRRHHAPHDRRQHHHHEWQDRGAGYR
jgi:hypothetical protein